MNGDILCDLDFWAFFREHGEAGFEVTVSAFRREVRVDFGVFENGDTLKMLKGFVEKPIYTLDVSMGIYCINAAGSAGCLRAGPMASTT